MLLQHLAELEVGDDVAVEQDKVALDEVPSVDLAQGVADAHASAGLDGDDMEVARPLRVAVGGKWGCHTRAFDLSRQRRAHGPAGRWRRQEAGADGYLRYFLIVSLW